MTHMVSKQTRKNPTKPAAGSSTSEFIQTKLRIGAENDPLEREADAMADRVMCMPETPLVQRACSKCAKEEKSIRRKPLAAQITPFIQRKSQVAGKASAVLSRRIQSTNGSGQRLSDSTKNFMESRFGANFSDVRIHRGKKAASMSNEMNARAFTVGRDIYFNSGQYAPRTSEGKRLLAHELTHVLQQDANRRSASEPRIMAKKKKKKKKPRVIDKTKKIHDFFPVKEDPCACLVHVHNDERNSKAVAHTLLGKCNYNLIDVNDAKSDAKMRNLKKSLKVITKVRGSTSRSDPNEIFDPEVIKLCSTPSKAPKGVALDEVCNFYEDIRTCSHDFTKPVVALHNNVKLAGKKKSESKADFKKRAVTESTNIHSWGLSDAIDKTAIEDKAHPDRVVWTSNPRDFEALKSHKGINAALQKSDYKGDTDLSTLFNFIPELYKIKNRSSLLVAAVLLAMRMSIPLPIALAIVEVMYMHYVRNRSRYINIETEHKKRVFDPTLAKANLDFVHKVLSALDLWCCDGMSLDDLKKDLANPVKKE